MNGKKKVSRKQDLGFFYLKTKKNMFFHFLMI
jgi:hypothetical protein